MREIINEFFSKDSKIRNKTIAELLEEYCIEERLFWNYVYSLNPIVVAKIKDENKRRETNNNSLEIYRLTKDGNLTFGDIACMKNITVDQVVALLQNEFLNKINHYSFEIMQAKNVELLKQKQEFKLYFYFLEHDVTFEELGKQFDLEESQVVYFFDSVLDSELTSEEIKKVFTLNKNRERNRTYQQNKQKLCDLFVLTEEEKQSIDKLISNFEEMSSQLYQKRIEALNYIKLYLSSEAIYMKECCHKLGVDVNTMRSRLQMHWIETTVMPSILIKLDICNLIEIKNISMCSEQKYSKIEHYMKIYAEYLNNPESTTQMIQQKYGIDIVSGNLIDQELNTSIFSEISDKIKESRQQKQISRLKTQIYEYYQNHFILFRDLGPIFNINQEELQQYYDQPENRDIWKSICEVEEQRIKRINANVKRITYFSKLLSKYQVDNDNNKLYDDLITLIGENRLVAITGKQKSYTDRLIRSILFTCGYIQQENYDVNDLKQMFHLKKNNDNTVYDYLNHEHMLALLDMEVKDYIHTKRNISHILGTRKGQQVFLQNQSYKYNERNEKGQFVKKHQTANNQE